MLAMTGLSRAGCITHSQVPFVLCCSYTLLIKLNSCSLTNQKTEVNGLEETLMSVHMANPQTPEESMACASQGALRYNSTVPIPSYLPQLLLMVHSSALSPLGQQNHA